VSTVSRKKADAQIHGYIRLQTAEELLKRVDTGFGQKSRAPFQAIVEGVQNAADAIDKAREALLRSRGTDDYDAYIDIKIDVLDKSRGEIEISIEDNGIGIPRSKVRVIVRAGGTGTVEYKASRSQQGIGWKAAAIYANQSTGKPLEIISKTYSEKQAHRHVYDYGKGKVTKIIEEPYEREFPNHGTRMTLNLIGDYPRARSNIAEFIKRMAAVHPYIRFIVRVNGTLDVYEKRNNSGIPIPKPVPPHPNSVDIGQLKDLLAAQSRIRSISLSGFLKRNFCRIGDKGIADLLERVSLLQYFDERGFFAGDIIKRIAQSSKLRELRGNYGKINSYLKTLVRDVDIDYDYATELVMRGKLNGNTNIRALSNTELERLFRVNDGELPKPPFTSRTTVNMILNDENRVRLLAEALRSMSFPSPPMDSLMPIPKDTFIEGFTSMYEPEKYAYVERRPTSTSGRPVQVQVLAMYGGNIPTNLKDQDKLIRIANCTPLLYEFGSDIVTQVAKEIDWSIYRIGKKGSLPDAPVIFVVHVTSPQLKYLGVAKQAIGADDVIAEEIRLALQAASRHLRSHVTMLARNKSAGKARKYLEHYAGIVSNSLSKMLKVKKEEVHDLLIQEINRRRPSVKDLPESFREW
jgi:DNA topoisomerase-6 subunit B